MEVFESYPEERERDKPRRFSKSLSDQISGKKREPVEHRVNGKQADTRQYEVLVSKVREPADPVDRNGVEYKEHEVRVPKESADFLEPFEKEEEWHKPDVGQRIQRRRRKRKPEKRARHDAKKCIQSSTAAFINLFNEECHSNSPDCDVPSSTLRHTDTRTL